MDKSGYSLEEIMRPEWKAAEQATLLFVVEAERILLIRKKRGLGAGKINGPGGRLDPGETSRQAAVREVQEELCITPENIHKAGRLRFQFIDGYSIEGFVFTAEKFTGEPAETDEAAPLWYPLNAIPYEEMWADDPLWIPMMLEGRRFSGYFIFDGDTMLEHYVQ